jgi:hypothetical protein
MTTTANAIHKSMATINKNITKVLEVAELAVLIGSSETVGSNDDLVDEVFDNKFNESDC